MGLLQCSGLVATSTWTNMGQVQSYKIPVLNGVKDNERKAR